jgi:hypothetical protein
MKSGFVVKQGKVSGTAGMIARAEGAKASYEWRCSLDGERWKDLPSTVQIHQDVAGLVAYRTLTKAGTGDWPGRVAPRGVTLREVRRGQTSRRGALHEV